MNIQHSNQLNDFLTFYIETRIDGTLKYETLIDYLNGTYEIISLDNKKSIIVNFDRGKNEKILEKEIKAMVEKTIKESLLHP